MAEIWRSLKSCPCRRQGGRARARPRDSARLRHSRAGLLGNALPRAGVRPGVDGAHHGWIHVNPDAGLRALARADTVVVPGYRPHDAPLDTEALSALRRAHGRGARMISICIRESSRSRRPASSTAAQQRRTGNTPTSSARDYPSVRVRPDVLYVDDGDVLTSAGVSSGVDLCLQVVRKDLGGMPRAMSLSNSWPPRTATATRLSSLRDRSMSREAGRLPNCVPGSNSNLEEPITLEAWPLAARCPHVPLRVTSVMPPEPPAAMAAHVADRRGATPLGDNDALHR